MNIESRVAILIMIVISMAIGCTEANPPKSSAMERAVSTKSALTSTLVPASPEPTVAKTPEPPAVEVADAPTAEEEQSFEPDLASVDGLTIRRVVTASGVEHREPVAASSVFRSDDERVYAFVEVSNASEEDEVLMAHFIGPDGRVSGGVELRIPATVPRWRTWAYTKHAKEPGLWRVEIRSVDGSLLAALPFEVDAPY